MRKHVSKHEGCWRMCCGSDASSTGTGVERKNHNADAVVRVAVLNDDTSAVEGNGANTGLTVYETVSHLFHPKEE